MRHKYLQFFLLLLLPAVLYAQKIDNTASFRDIQSERYFRIHYDNDYFAATDKNYTQGYSLELVSPGLKNNLVNYLFIKPAGSEIRYGLFIEHIGFTPKNIKSPEIQFGDRPFAAAIMLKSFLMATDIMNTSRFTSSFSAGIIGPGAFGKEMQVGIHKATGNVIPQGWQNQVKNDVVLNYEVGYEKQILKYSNLFSLQSNSSLRLGTLFTNASVGFNAMAGIINSPFTSVAKRDKFQFYIYSQPLVNAIAYDATLQGGLFQTSSPYTISTDDIERFTGQLNYGIILKTRSLYFEYFRSMITREFESGSSAKWGGIRLGFTF
jgi:hypothetical protein